MNYFRLCSLALGLSCLAFSQNTLTEIHTAGARPLHEALGQIEDYFHTQLFFEEIPHENPADLASGAELDMNPAFHYLRPR